MIRCSQCRNDLPIGSSFKTACQHILCEPCANRSFSADCFCPVCKIRLQAEDVTEFLVGVNPAVSLQENIFQFAFQDTHIPALLANATKIIRTASELSSFIHAQVSNQYQADAEEKLKLEDTVDAVKDNTTKALYEMREQGIVSSQQINILEQQISAKDEELRTLQDAYRTKLKKMEAWENAYYSLKGQIKGNANPQAPCDQDLINDENSYRQPSVPLEQLALQPQEDGYDHQRRPADSGLFNSVNSRPVERRCMYNKKTSITRIHGSPPPGGSRIGAEPHKKWFSSDSSSHYFKQNLATGSNINHSAQQHLLNDNRNHPRDAYGTMATRGRDERKDREPRKGRLAGQTNISQTKFGDPFHLQDSRHFTNSNANYNGNPQSSRQQSSSFFDR